MTALAADKLVDERLGRRFGYGLKAGVKLFRGSIVGVTSAGLARPAGTSGVTALVGLSPGLIDNTAGGDGAVMVEPRRGIFALTVPSATHTNIGANVYAVDDNLLSLSDNSAANLLLGKLVGIEAGQTYVEI
jgi:hypothetical protein